VIKSAQIEVWESCGGTSVVYEKTAGVPVQERVRRTPTASGQRSRVSSSRKPQPEGDADGRFSRCGHLIYRLVLSISGQRLFAQD
jgi:hypothetical protein